MNCEASHPRSSISSLHFLTTSLSALLTMCPLGTRQNSNACCAQRQQRRQQSHTNALQLIPLVCCTYGTYAICYLMLLAMEMLPEHDVGHQSFLRIISVPRRFVVTI